MSVSTLTSRIESVTVYRQGGLVTRVTEIAAGTDGRYPAQVRLAGLPLCLDDGSVRVRIEPEGDGSPPTAVDARVALEVNTPDHTLPPAANEALKVAERDVARIAALLETTDRTIRSLDLLVLVDRPAGKEGEPPQVTPVDARLELIGFRDRRLEELQARRRDTAKRLEKARLVAEDLGKRHEAASTARRARENELRKTVVVGLAGDGPLAGRSRLCVEYLVPGARWAPTYAMKFAPGFGKGTLALRALVAQRTGEDWSCVHLTLSTAQAQSWTSLPELKSQRISRRRQLPPRPGWRPAPEGADRLYEDYDRVFRPAPLPPAPPGTGPRGPMKPPSPPMACAPCSASMDVAPAASLLSSDTGAIASGPSIDLLQKKKAAAITLSRKRAASLEGRVGREKLETFGGLDDGLPPALPPGIVPETGLLDYGRLRMESADSPVRGRLRAVRATAPDAELFAAVNVQVTFDVTVVIAAAIRWASEIARQAPPGCEFAQSLESFDYAFRAEAPVDLESDGQFHSISLLSREATARLKHVAVPRESSNTFRVVSFTNPLDAPLLPGPIDISVADDFLITGRIGSIGPHADIELGLGVEQGIKVARNVRFHEATAGLMSGTVEAHHEIAVDVVNLLREKAEVEVRERIPRPANEKEEVTVELGRIDPPWEPFEQRLPALAGHRWRLTLAPGEKRSLSAAYVVKLPSRCEVVGGNRREE